MDLSLGECLPQPGHQVFQGNGSLIEEFLHEMIVALCHHLNDRLVSFRSNILHSRRDVDHLGFSRTVGFVLIRPQLNKVYNASESFLRTDWQMDWDAGTPKVLLNRVDSPLERSIVTIEFVHHERRRQVKLFRKFEDFLSLNLDACN